MGPSCHGFYRKMCYELPAFFIYIHLITYGKCDIENHSFQDRKLLNTLIRDRNLRSSRFYPVEVYFVPDKLRPEDLESSESDDDYDYDYDSNSDELLRTTREMDFKRDKVQTSKMGRLLRYQHRKKMEEIIDFLRDRYSSTNYFYEEMKRIQRQYTIKDKMREMIDYCENPENYKIKDKILALFEELKVENEKQLSIWNPIPNNLVINVLKDPYNDGVS